MTLASNSVRGSHGVGDFGCLAFLAAVFTAAFSTPAFDASSITR